MIRGASTAISATPGKIFIVVTWVLFRENRKATKKIIDLTTKKKVRIYLCPLSLSFKSLPHLKCGTFFSGTRTESPVFGFLPTLAGRRLTAKDPNPLISILLPATREDAMYPRIARTQRSQSLTSKACKSISLSLHPPAWKGCLDLVRSIKRSISSDRVKPTTYHLVTFFIGAV